MLVVDQREIGSNVESQAQLVSNHVSHVIEQRPCPAQVVDGSLVAAGTDASAVGKADMLIAHRHAAHIAPWRYLLAVTAHGDGLVILYAVGCVYPGTTPQTAAA